MGDTTSNRNNSQRHEEIVAFVCGTMSRDEQAAFAARMVDDTELATQVDAVRRALSPLNAWQAPEPEASLVDAIMREVETASPLKYVASETRMPSENETRPVRRGMFTLPQFFAVAASIALVLSVLFPTVQRQNDRKFQQACLGNLSRVGQGWSMYTNAYDGAMPQVDAGGPMNWLNNPQRGELEPMVRLGFVPPHVFVCPTTEGRKFTDASAAKDLAAFMQRTDLRFYAVQHPAAIAQRLRGPMPLPVFADQNPLFANGQFNDVDESANSPAHRGQGQNVLFTNVSAEFLKSPRFNLGDNIWRVEGPIAKYTGIESPVSATDSFLIP